ncbi:D-glycero-beta-D-manno-heptose-7-phosphate kinase [Mucilaginibacter pallidiroseus]|uniref:D-glycero-beta-D-manno-heptose-7-phosphate kinase n=1 Tax=Mucilaginibacter pallidiroseus TaxID=2599295 RepID=A0A563UBZ4_9SPHI|nr:D-glycero-beta-D-manno-heptose-7-phosphate kinase [Mucilaginibacter pallidiroseus]TWR28846.1 D-glycero-beta-D-manno-heptose-7-phosphate kinase [Mucilaginibacter pallidiroseus]
MLIDKLKDLQSAGCRPNLLVIGDIMIDHYMTGKASRLSPEAPVPVVNLKAETYTLGGAGNVVQNLVALGANVSISCATGDDVPADQVSEILKREGVNTDCILRDKDRATTVKTRILVEGHQLARLDKESTHNLNVAAEAHVIGHLEPLIQNADIVVLSDYNKGFLSSNLTRRIIQIAKQYQKKVIIDPKGSNYTKYSGAYVIKPNRSELAVAAKVDSVDTIADLQVAAKLIIEQTEVENLVVTLSEEGISIFNKKGITNLPVKATEVYDVTGAGDTVLATISFFVALGFDLDEACEIANYAAAIVIRQVGSATVTLEEIVMEIQNETHKFQASH